MEDDSKMKAVMGTQAFGAQGGNDGDSVDRRIEENIQKRELMKLRTAFHDQLK